MQLSKKVDDFLKRTQVCVLATTGAERPFGHRAAGRGDHVARVHTHYRR